MISGESAMTPDEAWRNQGALQKKITPHMASGIIIM